MLADGADVVVCWVPPGLLRTRRQQLSSDTQGKGGGGEGGFGEWQEALRWVPCVGVGLVGLVSFRLLTFQGQIFAAACFELWQMELY